MKATMYWKYPARSVMREGQRGLLAVLCISIGVLAIVTLQLIANMVNTSLTGNILIEQLAASGLVTLVTASGSVLRSGSLPVNITSADVEIQASIGIGTLTNPLQTTVQRLEASGGSEGVFFANSGNLQIGGISPSRIPFRMLAIVSSICFGKLRRRLA